MLRYLNSDIAKRAGIENELEQFEKARQAFKEACKHKVLQALADLVREYAPRVRAFRLGWEPSYDSDYGFVASRELDAFYDEDGNELDIYEEIKENCAAQGKQLTEEEIEDIVQQIIDTVEDVAELLEEMEDVRLGIIYLPVN